MKRCLGTFEHMWLVSFSYFHARITFYFMGCVAQSVTCLASDARLTPDPGVVSSIPAQSNTLVEIDNEIISTVILLPSAE